MEKEIGGYFGLEEFGGREYYPDLIAVNNGRSALLYILKAREIRKLYIPYFLCSSVSEMCRREGYEYECYSIGRDFLPVFQKTLAADEYLYIVNYYGQIGNDVLLRLRQRYGNVIFDNVQAFFQPPAEGVDTVYSCRKFFGVPDGGYVSTDAGVSLMLKTDRSAGRMKHVLGRFEGKASDHYGDFKENDHSFGALPLMAMSKLTHNLLRAIDYDAVKTRRSENYAVLDHVLGYHNKLDLTVPVGPYCYPFYCKNGMEMKRKLAEKKIYVATLWPNLLQMENALEKELAENILPLPCDQRYDHMDMKKMAEMICQLMEE